MNKANSINNNNKQVISGNHTS